MPAHIPVMFDTKITIKECTLPAWWVWVLIGAVLWSEIRALYPLMASGIVSLQSINY